MSKMITSIATPAVLTAFKTAINTALIPLNPFKINLTDEQKKGTRSMAEGREGYARLISRIANQFPNSLSRADVPTELSNLLDYYNNLEANKMALLQALETIDEIQLATATDVMTLVDRYTANLQVSRGNEGSLDLAMAEVDEWNKRFAHKTEAPAKVPADL
ncbi:hypothetical protein [Flavobacterium aquicola]|uniref:Uncharacterized protein n=1 Tax=Flavobacterium aquicola TaxID=1682742 RepID=A0A3E0ERI6_9FLAO|nr:hypothetical protein [Flavobacterium aquicola]REH00833.1 hypothetical protein C8P67_10281 [Flavobacterium aquicola]